MGRLHVKLHSAFFLAVPNLVYAFRCAMRRPYSAPPVEGGRGNLKCRSRVRRLEPKWRCDAILSGLFADLVAVDHPSLTQATLRRTKSIVTTTTTNVLSPFSPPTYCKTKNTGYYLPYPSTSSFSTEVSLVCVLPVVEACRIFLGKFARVV